MNVRSAPLDGADFYPTPSWATHALLLCEKFEGSVLEPCCGDGSMAKVIQEAGYSVTSSDKFDRGFGAYPVDAFTYSGNVTNVITNPPYNLAYELLDHFLPITDNKIALLLRLSFLESKKRYSLFQTTPPSTVHIFSERLSLAPAGTEVQGGGTVSYGWFVWDKADTSKQTVLKWLPPGLKPTIKRKARR
jgi:hypothetical protein